MNLQIALVLLIGMISALNANFYEEYDYEYGENDSNDYYENLYDDPATKTKEKIRELIRVNNEMPCLKFLLSSNGIIQILTPDKLGVYILAIDLLIADRLVYMMERPPELFVFLSGWNPDTKEYYDWRILRFNENQEFSSYRVIENTDCRDTELPANGDCDDGWRIRINRTHVFPDETASIECLEYISYVSPISTVSEATDINERSTVISITPEVSSVNSIACNSESCDKNNPCYVGCYKDDLVRDLDYGPGASGEMSSWRHNVSTCNAECKRFTYFSLQFGGQCFCGDAYSTESKYQKRPDSECSYADGKGGFFRNKIYRTCNKKDGINSIISTNNKISINENDKLVLTCHASSKWQFCKWKKSLDHNTNKNCDFEYHFDWSNNTNPFMHSCDEKFRQPLYRIQQGNETLKGVCEIEFSSVHLSLGGKWSCELYECENLDPDCWNEGNWTSNEFVVEVKQNVSSLANPNSKGLESQLVIIAIFIIFANMNVL